MAKLNDVEKARAILDTYEYPGVEFLIGGEGTLEVVVAKEKHTDWLAAVKKDRMPRREQYADEGSWKESVNEVIFDTGEHGFDELLIELAACLETELMIVSLTDEDWCAHAMRIKPGATKVDYCKAWQMIRR